MTYSFCLECETFQYSLADLALLKVNKTSKQDRKKEERKYATGSAKHEILACKSENLLPI